MLSKKKKYHRLDQADVERIIPLKAEGKTTKEVALLLNCHPATIDSWIRKLRAYGLKVPVQTNAGKSRVDLSKIPLIN